MKLLPLVSFLFLSSLLTGCTTTRIDDHSYHYNDKPAVNHTTNIIYKGNTHNEPSPSSRPQSDQEFLQYKQDQDVDEDNLRRKMSLVPNYYIPESRQVNYIPSRPSAIAKDYQRLTGRPLTTHPYNSSSLTPIYAPL
jgi:hypothetical protein